MSVLDNLGYIAKAQFYPCDNPPFTLAIEAAFKAGTITLWSAATFGCLDIIKMRAGISPWHTRGLRGLIGGILTAAESDQVNGIYKFLIPVEKMLFFWFVVDLTTGFFANWQSQLFKLGACDQKPDDCSWSGTLPPGGWVAPHQGAKMLVTYATTSISGNCHGTPSNGFFVPEGHFFSAHFTLAAKKIIKTFPDPNLSLWLEQNEPNGFIYNKNTGTPPWIGNDTKVSYMINGQNKKRGGRQYSFWASGSEPAVATGGSANVYTSPFPIHNSSIIPVNCFGGPAPSGATPI